MAQSKERAREYHREWYQKNKERRKAINRACRQRLQARYQAYKQTLKCEICSEDEPCCLDFHHLNEHDKEHNIANMIANTYSWEKIMTEVKKCAVLCKNCHTKVHAGIVQLARTGDS